MPFDAEERRLLLSTPGIGPGVMQRLETAGYGSLDVIRERGVDHVIEDIVSHLNTTAWRNRREALSRAVSLWSAQAHPADAGSNAVLPV